MCCSPWGCKESDATDQLSWTFCLCDYSFCLPPLLPLQIFFFLSRFWNLPTLQGPSKMLSSLWSSFWFCECNTFPWRHDGASLVTSLLVFLSPVSLHMDIKPHLSYRVRIGSLFPSLEGLCFVLLSLDALWHCRPLIASGTRGTPDEARRTPARERVSWPLTELDFTLFPLLHLSEFSVLYSQETLKSLSKASILISRGFFFQIYHIYFI